MALITLRVPPGVYRVGTEYGSRGRWVDANLMRWYRGVLMPVGGWRPLRDAQGRVIGVPGRPNGIHVFRDYTGTQRLVLGSTRGVRVFDGTSRALADITPTNFPAWTPNLDDLRPQASPPLSGGDPSTWSLDNFGRYPVGVNSGDGILRYWNTEQGATMDWVDELAPPCRAVVVTPERFLMALGAVERDTAYLYIHPTYTWTQQDVFDIHVGQVVYRIQPSGGVTGHTDARVHVAVGGDSSRLASNLMAAINASQPPAIGVYAPGSQYFSVALPPHLYGLRGCNPDVIARQFNDTTLVLYRRTHFPGGLSSQPLALQGDVSPTGRVTVSPWSPSTAGANRVQWASQETLNTWEVTESTTAGAHILNTAGVILAGRALSRETLIWTDADLHAAIYVGGDMVYRFEPRGEACGAVGPNAMCVTNDVAYWFGANGFFRYDGRVVPIECDVYDHVFTTFDRSRAHEVGCMSNAHFHEIWWFYPTTDGGHRYVVYNYAEGHWAIGVLDRAVGADRGAWPLPLIASSDGVVWEHETGVDRPGGGRVFVESGPVEIGEGNNVYMLRSLVPDERNLGQVDLYVTPKLYPTDPDAPLGPFSITAPTPLRVTARSMKLRLQETHANSDFRVGDQRVDVVLAGER